MASTWIRNADVAIAWDAAAGTHAYLRDADVVFRDGTIAHVGHGYAGTADTVVDGRGLMAMPGLVNVHAHPATEPFFRGIREEHGVPGAASGGQRVAGRGATPRMA